VNGAFFSTLIKSSTDFKFYKNIWGQSLGLTLRYLLLLTIFVTVLLGIRYGLGFNVFAQKGLKWIEENIPKIEITNGEVTADVSQPFVKEMEDFVMIIDTTGQTMEIDKKYKTGVLLTKNKIIVKNDEVRSQEFDLSKIQKFQVTKESFKKVSKYFVLALIPFVIGIQFVYFFFAKIAQSVVAGIVVMIAKPGLRFVNVLNVCIYAVTPVSLLGLLMTLGSPKPLPFFWLIYLGMYIAFVVGAVGQCTQENSVEV